MEKNIFQLYVCTLLILLSLFFIPQETQAACSNGGTCALGGGITCNNDADCSTDGPCNCNAPPAATATPVPAATNTPVPAQCNISCGSGCPYCGCNSCTGACDFTCDDNDNPSDPTPTFTPAPDPAKPTATPTVIAPTATDVPPTATPTRLPTPPSPELLGQVCADDGWSSTFSWDKPDFPVNPIKNFILGVNMINKWMETKPTDDIISWTQWFLADGSDKHLITANTSEKVTVIPFRPYYDWSVQTVGTDDQVGPTVLGNTFSCRPNYTMVSENRTTTCYDDNGNIRDECSIEKFIAEYRQQHGYSVSPTVEERKYFNLAKGKNAYKFDTVMAGVGSTQAELIDLLDFEAWRRLRFSPNATGTPTPTATPTPTTGPCIPSAEVCDGIDNNCDGTYDEGGVCAGASLTPTNTPTPTPTATPTPAPITRGYKKVSAGQGFTCAIKYDDSIACWGGLGTDDNKIPEQINGKFVQLSSGASYMCAITKEKRLNCWGYGFQDSFMRDGSNPDVQMVHVGNPYSCFLDLSNSLGCWTNHQVNSGNMYQNSNKYSQIVINQTLLCGIKMSDNSIVCENNQENIDLENVEGPFNEISAPYIFSYMCAIKDSGGIQCWGKDNSFGELIPPSGGDFTKISTGTNTSCALDLDNILSCWGYVKIPDTLKNTPFQEVSVSNTHTCAIKKIDNSMVCWGSNRYGESTPPSDSLSQNKIPDNVLFN
ncbi:hypothetical protein KBD81_05925 [Candidatus Woesebacteria bacterium]|nr:hypothetical protein [Candidatus Woesebacteria bacterium]